MRNILFLLLVSLSFSSYSQEEDENEKKNQVLFQSILKFQDTLNLILDYQL